MARPPKEAPSPSALAPALLRWVASRVECADLLAQRCGLAEADREADELTVTSTALGTLLEATTDALADPHVALRLPSELPVRRYDAAALAARAAETPRAALEITARLASLVFPRLEAWVESDEASVRFHARVAGRPRGLGLAVDEYILAYALGHCRRGGVAVTPTSAWLVASRPVALAPLFHAVGTREIAFGAETTGFALTRADADLTLPGGDAVLVATAEHLASSALARTPRAGRLATTVAQRIESALPGDASADTIAKGLHMSGRTLQRRLEDEGTRFSEVLDGVREKLAERLLGDDTLPLAEIAYRAGFADLATFSRAFKRWRGVPPGAYRRKSRPF